MRSQYLSHRQATNLRQDCSQFCYKRLIRKKLSERLDIQCMWIFLEDVDMLVIYCLNAFWYVPLDSGNNWPLLSSLDS